MMLKLWALLSSLILFVKALDVTGDVAWTQVCPNFKALGRARVVLNNGKYSATITQDGAFTISNVAPGVYLLSVINHDYAFEQLRLDVLEASVVVRPYVPGTPLNPPSTITLPYPMVLNPKQKYNFFVPPESFNVMGMLGSPMMLMMIFGGAMVLGMPYLMKNMNPEALEDMKAQQAQMAKVQSAVASGDLKSGFSALMSSFDEAPNAQQSPQKGNTANKKKATKKR